METNFACEINKQDVMSCEADVTLYIVLCLVYISAIST